MIARVWHGWTRPENGDAYEAFLSGTLLPAVKDRVAGFRGGYVLRRRTGSEDEFAVVTFFDSLDAVRGFAGEEYDVPVIEPQAAQLLTRFDERAVHYERVAGPGFVH